MESELNRLNPVSKSGRADVFGVQVDCLTMDEVVQKVSKMIASGRPHILATADTSGVVQAQEDPKLMEIYQRADLVTPDSYGVIWALKRRGRVQERVTGVDLVDRLCRLSSETGAKIFILGSAPGVADLAAEKLRLLHPGCQIVGTRHGYFPAEDDSIVAEEIAPYQPDILFVAMGIPRQEKFILGTQGTIRAKVAVGVGGSFDVYSGQVKRAPLLIQKLRLEWLWRLLLNPKKISKAKNLPVFAMMELKRKR